MSETASESDDKHNGFWVSRKEAYKIGTSEAADHPVIFIDPDLILEKAAHRSHRDHDPREFDPDIVRARTFKSQMERQVPGSTEALQDLVERGTGRRLSVSDLAKCLKGGPKVIVQRIVVGDQEYGVAITPPYDFNSKSEMVDSFTGHLGKSARREIYENTPGTNNDWMRYFGNHEGTHLEINSAFGSSNLETLIEERRADQGAMDLARERGQGDIALAFKDLRALDPHLDPTHATTPIVDQNDQVTEITYNMAKNSFSQIKNDIKKNFDFSSHKANGGKATNPQELLREDPEAYFDAAQKALDDQKNEAMEDYNADPTLFDSQRAVVEVQLKIDYQKSFEDAYRRRALGQDIPEREPTQLISQEAEDAYLANRELHEEMMVVEMGLNDYVYTGSEFSSEVLLENYDWASYPREVEDRDDLTMAEDDKLVLELLGEKKAEVLEDFKNNPSLETYERLLKLQSAINATTQYANIELVKSGEKPIEPEVLISGADKQEFLINHVEEQERMAAIEAEIGDVRDTHKFSVWRAYSEEGRIFENFDWENYEGEATTASELFFENEEVYLRHATSTLEEMKQEALDAYKDDPSYENTGKLLEVQYIIESKIDVLRMAADGAGTELSPDLSQKPHVLVSEEVELAYYRERKQRLEVEEKLEVEASKEKAREVESVPAATTVSGVQVEATQEAIAEEPDKGYQKGINGGAYTIKVNAESNGQPIVSFHQDGSSIETPNGKAMPQVFGEAVSPDPDSIVSVDPKVAIVPMLPSDGEMQAEQSAMTPV